jgi:hypothetical protein
MTSTAELVDAICLLLGLPRSPVPVSLMNHEPPLARQIIVDVVERAATKGLHITEIRLDPEFATSMSFANDAAVSAEVATKVVFEPELGRQVFFCRDTI